MRIECAREVKLIVLPLNAETRLNFLMLRLTKYFFAAHIKYTGWSNAIAYLYGGIMVREPKKIKW